MTAKEKQTEEREVLTAILDGIRHTPREEWLEQIRGYEAEYSGEVSLESIEAASTVSAQSAAGMAIKPARDTKTASARTKVKV